MTFTMTFFQILGFLLGLQAVKSFRLMADIQIAGYQGKVKLSPSGVEETDTSVEVNISGPNAHEFIYFNITKVPPIFGQMDNARDVCNRLEGNVLVSPTREVTIGRDVLEELEMLDVKEVDIEISGVESSGEFTINEGSGIESALTFLDLKDGDGESSGMEFVSWSYVIPMFTTKEAFNRGIFITNSNNRPINPGMEKINLCATLLPVKEEVVTHRATFLGPVYGRVWIRSSKSTQGTFIYSDLSFLEARDGEDATSTSNFTLTSFNAGNIHYLEQFSNRCFLSAPLNIATVQVGNSAAVVDTTVSLTAPSICESALGKFLGLKDSKGGIVACTQLERVNSKTVTASIDWDNVHATVSMTQNSPFDATSVNVQVTALTKEMLPAVYGINHFPVPAPLPRYKFERCDADNVGDPFNPYGVAPLPTGEAVTFDQFSIGDLSGKYGKILVFDESGVNISTTDWNLPLFGINSVVGRSVVITGENSDRKVCGTIEFTQGVVTAVATFKQPIYGSIYFRQALNNPGDDVIIFGELANLNSSTTYDNVVDIHNDPVGAACNSTGDRFDPSGISNVTAYEDICSNSNYYFCRLGDLFGKHGGIDIIPQLHGSNEFFFSSAYLPLAGPLTIIGRSIVVYGPEPEDMVTPFACANITMVHTTKVRNTLEDWYGDNTGGVVVGSVTLEQAIPFDRTKVNINVTGLDGEGISYGIHTTPVDTDDEILEKCSNEYLGGVFNPFEVPFIAGRDESRFRDFFTTYDQYPAGDLSGKYGYIFDLDQISVNAMDNNLALTTGILSVAGRSVSINKPQPSGRPDGWKCTTLDLQPEDNSGHIITARAFLSDDLLSAYVDLTQVVYDDGFTTVTTIRVSSGWNRLVPFFDDNWHIHKGTLENVTDCTLTHGVYDPYNTLTYHSTQFGYNQNCDVDNQLACAVGDLSRKQSSSNIEHQKKLYVDEDVPLTTDKTVIGRSIMFHTENGGSDRAICANIKPTSPSFTVAFPSSVEYDYYRFTQAVALTLGISRHRVVVISNIDVPLMRGGCSRVLVTIAGQVDMYLLDWLVNNVNPFFMHPYLPTLACMYESGVEQYLGMPSGGSVPSFNFIFVLVAVGVTAFSHLVLS